jgi:hypothetical protein
MWFCLRLVKFPVIQMMEGAAATPPTQATATDGDHSADVGTDEPETVCREGEVAVPDDSLNLLGR